MKLCAVVFIFMCGTSLLYAQNNTQKKCYSSEEFRQFDFWVGEWNVQDSTGAQLGESSVQRILDGCVILENWENKNSGYSGKSFNYYNANLNTWEQKWIDNQGVPIEFKGNFFPEEKALKFDGIAFENGKEVSYKLNFYSKEADYVQQQFFRYDELKKSWVLIFDGHYHRKL